MSSSFDMNEKSLPPREVNPLLKVTFLTLARFAFGEPSPCMPGVVVFFDLTPVGVTSMSSSTLS